MTFTTAIDPGGQETDRYFSQGYIPLNMVVADEMVIRYKAEDYSPNGIRSIVSQLVSE